jgi:argininosuccinate synthase
MITTEPATAVVAVTVDVGQARDVQAIRDAALAAGAVRAHVFDAVDEFARRCVLPAIQSAPSSLTTLASSARLAYPVIAAKLAEVARLEGATAVVHGGGEQLTAAIRSVDPRVRVVPIVVNAIKRERPQPAAAGARHLLQRPIADPARARGVAANIVIEFAEAIPVSINGVALPLPELMESLSLLGGEHGIGYAEAAPAPAALVLDAAYRALDHRSGVVRIELLDGRQRVVSTDCHTSVLVNLA